MNGDYNQQYNNQTYTDLRNALEDRLGNDKLITYIMNLVIDASIERCESASRMAAVQLDTLIEALFDEDSDVQALADKHLANFSRTDEGE